MFNRFYRIQLPQYLGFFAGKRFVPIVTALAAIAVGIVLAFVWPPIGYLIEVGANGLLRANTALAVFVYGIVERALLPFGLHHIWNAPFFFTLNVGGWSDCNGILTCFFAGHPESGISVAGSSPRCSACRERPWRSGGRRAREPRAHRIDHDGRGADRLPHRDHRAPGVLVPVRRAAALRGARVPGRARLPDHVPGRRPAGLHFSHGAIDYVLFWANDIRPWLVLIIGPIYFVLYFVVFTVLIRMFNLMTLGREADTAEAGEASG